MRAFSHLILVGALGLLVGSCGGGGGSHGAVLPPGGSNGAGNGVPGATGAQALYVSNHVECPPFPCAVGVGSVTTYPAAGSGNIAPLTMLSGARTDLDLPVALTVNGAGDSYIVNQRVLEPTTSFTLTRVTKYAPGATGDTAPIAQFYVFPFGAVSQAALDPQGNLLLSWSSNSPQQTALFVYPPNTNQEFAEPQRTITGPKVSLEFTIDKNGNFYIAEGSHVEEFSASFSGSDSPIGVFELACATSPIDSIAVGDDGKVYVRSTAPDALTVFTPAVHGMGTVLAQISGPKTNPMPGSVQVDRAGNLYLAGGDRIVMYPPGANGDVAPTHVIAGPATQLQLADDLALGPVPPPPGPTPTPTSTPTPNPNAPTLYVSALTSPEAQTAAILAFTNGVYDMPAYMIDDPSQSQVLAVDSHRTLFASLGALDTHPSPIIRVFPLGATLPAATITAPDTVAALVVDGNDNLYANVKSALVEYAPGNFTTPLRVLQPRAGYHFASNPRTLAINKVLNEPVIFMSSNQCCNGFIEVYGASGTAPILEIPYAGTREDVPAQTLAVDSTGEVYFTQGHIGEPTLGYAPGATTPSLSLPEAVNVAIGANDAVYLQNDLDHGCPLAQVPQSIMLMQLAARSNIKTAEVDLHCHGDAIFTNAMQVARDGTLYLADVDHFIFSEELIFSSLTTAPIVVRSPQLVALRGMAVGP